MCIRDRIKFIPENWEKTYFDWMYRIEDWCISRQIWWGHRIPAWYDPSGQVYVGRSEAEVRQKHQLGPDVALEQDPDVLDTWFSVSYTHLDVYKRQASNGKCSCATSWSVRRMSSAVSSCCGIIWSSCLVVVGLSSTLFNSQTGCLTNLSALLHQIVKY